MAPDSSPLPIRHSNALPSRYSINRASIPIDIDDDYGEATVPCSPGAVLRHDDTTQPTQVLSRPTLQSSSPPSVIEVPASSPFQQPSKRPRLGPGSSLGSIMAPAGTMFRPPPKMPTPTNTHLASKRPAPDPIDLISDDDDDDDDLEPPRGDIKPTSFKSQIAGFAYNPQASKGKERDKELEKERQMRGKLKQIWDVYGTRYSADVVRSALDATDMDVEQAVDWLKRNGSKPSKSHSQGKPTGRRLVSKANLQASRLTSPTPSPASPSPVRQKPAPKRRLIQGRRNPSTPSPQKTLFDPGSGDEPLVIDLVEDKDEAYHAERSPTPDDDSNNKVLNYLNTSTLQELAAITSMKESQLEPMIKARPFDDLAQARRVTVTKNPGAKKKAKVGIGETAVDALEVFLNAVEAIDHIVAQCEKKATTVKEVMDTWDMNSFGHSKRSARSTPDVGDLPLTPTSLTGQKLRKPPIPEQPAHMDGHCQMKPFQLFGLNWMSLLHTYEIGCILADEMGLGKTCQVISLMSHLVENYEKQGTKRNNNGGGDRPWPNLIVVPPSTYNNWLAEFEKFAPELSVMGYRGSQSERMEIAYEVSEAPEDYHVVLGTYSQINSEEDLQSLNSMNLHAAIFDEGHKMKNPETKIYKDLRRITTDWKMLLTGTPVQNNLLEMTSLLSFINPKMFEGYMEPIKYMFSQKVSIRDVSNGAFLYSERVKRARTILEPFILQRRKDQVLSDMPQKINSVVLCDLTEDQRPVYDEYEAIFKTDPSQRTTKQKAPGRQNDQNNVWMQLRKAAIHPLLFRRHFTDVKLAKMGKILMDSLPQSELHQPNLEHLIQELKNSSDFELHLWCRDYPRLLGKFDYPPEAELNSGKVKKLLELVDQYQESGDRVLVFSKFSRVIELLREVLALKGIDHRVLMGNTNVAERQSMIDEFNENADIPVFLLTTGAGGTGINLTSANKVVIFDQSDNPQDDIQAENRAHRLGQKRDVEVIRLISRGTLEELIHKACQKKIELAKKVTGAEGEVEGEAEQQQQQRQETEQESAKNLEHEVRQMMEQEMTPP